MELSDILRRELQNDILPFWMNEMPLGEHSFRGRIDGECRPVEGSPLSGIMVARILWTFASAVTVVDDDRLRARCMDMARRAERLLTGNFMDHKFGGSFWSIGEDGSLIDGKKQYYAIAFAVYALSAMHKAGSPDALDNAIELYHSIRTHSLDPVHGGYMEASTRDWQPIADMRLSEKDRNDAKTMNTHLHILEAWTALYSVWKDETLRGDLRTLIELFLERIIRPDGHLGLFFTEDWRMTDTTVSYGHDIECSWLLMEAALALGDDLLTSRVRTACAAMASAAMEGYCPGEGMYYESDGEHVDRERHWWVQAEAVVGCMWQARSTGDPYWTQAALDIWNFISANLLAPEGEWYWSVLADGTINRKDDRAGFWKCPYHNGRMCMEVLWR